MNSADFFHELLVVMVMYKIKPEESAAYTSLQTALNNCSCFPEIFIYDNSPLPNPPPIGTYVHDPVNSGVSLAYNTAATYAASTKKKWMLFLDQDTTVHAAFFGALSTTVSNHPESVAFAPLMRDSLGLVSPFYFAWGGGRRIRTTQVKLSLKQYRFVNSGLLIRLSSFVQAGGYDTDIRLDFSDIHFAERLRHIADHFVVVNSTLNHNFSGAQVLSADDALVRFQSYRTGARSMARHSRNTPLYFVRIILRASHLCFRYRDLRFMTAVFQ